MNIFRQIFTVTMMNFRSLPQRFWASLVIVVGFAATVAVLLSMLSMTTGLRQIYTLAGSPGRAIIASLGADNEGRAAFRTTMSRPS